MNPPFLHKSAANSQAFWVFESSQFTENTALLLRPKLVGESIKILLQ